MDKRLLMINTLVRWHKRGGLVNLFPPWEKVCYNLSKSRNVKRVGSALISHTIRALAQSMSPKIMVVLARKLIPGYDLYARTGFPTSIAIPNKDAARQIVSDIVKSGQFLELILLLVEVGEKGHMGRRYAIPYMREILRGVYDMGFLYDPANKIFMENPELNRTRNWGALREDTTYTLAFLRIDIVGNLKIVRENPAEKVNAAYDALREMTYQAVGRRNGRIWGWDGDGGVGAFFVGNRNQSAVLAGMELLHEIFIYNRVSCPLKDPVVIRAAVHSGPFDYTTDEEEMKANETVKRTTRIESKHTKPGTLTISPVVKLMLDHIVAVEFTPFMGKDHLEYFNYALELEAP